ncbi:MAG: YciI family protein [Pseudomonadota bacterium]|nr:YciI family protein [Pseudomonadota bacterium]
MTRYLISFDDGAMAHIPVDEWGAVGEAAHAVVRKAKVAGVWIHGGGVEQQRASIVGTDGAVAPGPWPETKAVIGGFSIIQAATRAEALEWAARIASACRCAQEVRELMDDPQV